MTDNAADDSGTAASTSTAPMPQASPQLDYRRVAVRADLAALSLRGSVQVPRYSAGVARQVARPIVPLRRQPDPSLGFETEVLYGEVLTVYDEANGWAWVQLQRDNYVGYLPADVLSADMRPPTHRVRALGTFVYPVADIKAPPLMHLSLNTPLGVAEETEQFCRLERGGFVIRRHVIELQRFERDFVDVAERFIGTPYLWGGRTRIGIDCSGLVQTALEAAGLLCPRDSDMQAAELGQSVLIPQNLEGLRRGDLVFWRGHVGMMVDGLMLLHANAHHMAVVMETLPAAVARIAKQRADIKAIQRLPALSATASASKV